MQQRPVMIQPSCSTFLFFTHFPDRKSFFSSDIYVQGNCGIQLWLEITSYLRYLLGWKFRYEKNHGEIC